MDLHGALSALIRQPTGIPAAFPFASFLPHPMMTSLPFSLGNAMVDPLSLGITAAEPQAAATPKKARLDSPCSPLSQSSTVSSTQLSSPQPSPIRKIAKPIPDEKKDDAYYERRRRNNDAAKRSRDARRVKEEVVAARAAQLERENGQLRGQVALLKSETARLQLLLFSRQHLPTTSIKQQIKSESINAAMQDPTNTVLKSEREIKP
ncbi:hypothetical protein RB195_005610 [Necator americanus]|uniref:Basic region leucine zipper n=2 Tax=Necator americanus TaxID=51031 RepID=W2T473_NECAM|nr:basic region leucine zipper [Necator americanus]ETN76708.1 basic region leucine zipper [Necator americanus]